MQGHAPVAVVLLIFHVIDGSHAGGPQSCDRVFVHTYDGPDEGTFSSPGYPDEPYPSNLQCLYTFVGKAGKERVQLQFEDFLLTGSKPRCEIDYLDIYSELNDQRIDLIQDGVHSGRYCGSISPGMRISLHHVIVLVLHSQPKTPRQRGFHGNWKFIPNDAFIVGTAMPNENCAFVISSTPGIPQTGSIISPSYPGKYPSNLQCWYKMIGLPGQRVHLKFEDFDLYFGGQHCPYDSVTVYDGDSRRAPIIQKACGLQQQLEIFSERNFLFVEFNSTDPIYSEHRGFKIRYEFSRSFVNLDKMKANEDSVEHIRGTECDLRVKSGKGTSHIIRSPNYPSQYPKNKTCTYVLDGRKSADDLEKVILTFKEFNIASPDNCGEAFLEVYEGSQDPKTEDPKHPPFCGSGIPPDITSKGARLTVIFKSAPNMNARGFQAEVKFVTDFGIPGKAVDGPDKCNFEFNSMDGRVGRFNSPRYPSTYPTQIKCTYHLIGHEGEQVKISFSHFELHAGLSEQEECNNDYLEAFNIFPHGLPSASRDRRRISPRDAYDKSAQESSLRLGRYCSHRKPGVILSEPSANKMKIIFYSDEDGTATGFEAAYSFRMERSQVTPEQTARSCGAAITNEKGGSIESPDYNQRYGKDLDCHWLITVRKGYQVMAQLMNITMEGEMKTENDRTKVACLEAVVLVYPNMTGPPTYEFCGAQVNLVPKHFLSHENKMRITFLTGPNVNGLEGFRMSWTEVHNTTSGICSNEEFKCKKRKWCIDKGLICNGLYNCGDGDISDEETCAAVVPCPQFWLSSSLSMCILLFSFLSLHSMSCIVV